MRAWDREAGLDQWNDPRAIFFLGLAVLTTEHRSEFLLSALAALEPALVFLIGQLRRDAVLAGTAAAALARRRGPRILIGDGRRRAVRDNNAFYTLAAQLAVLDVQPHGG